MVCIIIFKTLTLNMNAYLRLFHRRKNYFTFQINLSLYKEFFKLIYFSVFTFLMLINHKLFSAYFIKDEV